jgi:hypothetical protein
MLSWVAMTVLVIAPVLAQEPKVHLIHLDPQPAISGGCPAKVHFTGRIGTTGPLAVTYQWLRSDGSHTDHTIQFERKSERPISTDWTISKNYSGWVQLVILEPARLQTIKANFSVNCGK